MSNDMQDFNGSYLRSASVNPDVPSLVLDYFGHPEEPVMLAQVHNRHGWSSLRKQAGNWQSVFYFAENYGARSFAFQLGSRVADFTLDELETYARRGAFARPYYCDHVL